MQTQQICKQHWNVARHLVTPSNKINNTQVDNTKYLDILMPVFNLIDYSNNYEKILERLWQYHKDIPN